MSNYQAVTVSTKINGEDISLRVTPIGQYHNLFTSTIANVFRRHGSSSVEVEGDIGGHLELCWGSTDPKQGHSFTHLPIVGYDSTGGLIPGVITLGRVAPINLTSTKAGALGEDLADMLSNPFEYTGQV